MLKSILKNTLFSGFIAVLLSCTDNTAQVNTGPPVTLPAEETDKKAKQFRGAFSNGMKGDSLFFKVSADGKKLQELTFKGYWRCAGKLEQQRGVGPEGSFDIINGKASGHISDPPDGGSTAWRFDIDATISGNTASGTFRMNINNLGCDTYLLKFDAVSK
ncbi:MAG: hypothetical protein WKF88_07550 [Ferruginibacter sp.]